MKRYLPDNLWSALEFELFLFPVLVVLAVSLAFLLKCECSHWHWWIPLGVTWLLSVQRLRKADGAIVIGCGVAFLLLVWILTGISVSSFFDGLAYHLPGIRLLTLGWNPVWQGTPEALSAMGYDPEQSWFLHIFAMPKSVWYFNAVAYFFFQDPWNIMFPLLPFVFLATTTVLWRIMVGVDWKWKALAVLALFLFLPGVVYVVDDVVALSGIGLLLSMYEALCRKRWNWLGLLVFSFWMCTAKQTGLLHCAIFWGLFSFGAVRCKEMVFRFASIALLFLALILVVNASPYLSAWRNYGHPLYPKCSGDIKSHPTYDITSDFFNQNADAKEMGCAARYLSSYCSKTIVNHFFKLNTGRAEFNPQSQYWPGDAPTTNLFRCSFLVSLLVIFLLGDKNQRWIACWVCVAIGCMPVQMLGYVRYVPWVFAIHILAIMDLGLIRNSRSRFALWGCIGAGALCWLGMSMSRSAYCVEQRHALNRWLANGKPFERIYTEKHGYDVAFPGHSFYIRGLNIQLLMRQVKKLERSTVTFLPDGELISDANRIVPFFDYSFGVDDVGLLCGNSMFRRMQHGLIQKTWYNYARFVAKSWTVDCMGCVIDRFSK